MMKLFCMALLAGCLCCGSARSGVRMVDVVGGDTFTWAIELISSRVNDSSSCKKVVGELSREADRVEKAWREAFMSGEPSTREWCRIADAEARLFRKMAESRKQEKRRKSFLYRNWRMTASLPMKKRKKGFPRCAG